VWEPWLKALKTHSGIKRNSLKNGPFLKVAAGRFPIAVHSTHLKNVDKSREKKNNFWGGDNIRWTKREIWENCDKNQFDQKNDNFKNKKKQLIKNQNGLVIRIYI
jgi:hypothetical protein